MERDYSDTENDKSFERHAAEGAMFCDAFDLAKEESPYQSFNELTEHGWEMQSRTHVGGRPMPGDESLWGLYWRLGLSTTRVHNTVISWIHKHDSKPNYQNQIYRATDGNFSCVYNPHAIIVRDSHSPAYMGAKRNIKGDDLVPLHHWSDVVFLQWKQYCEERTPRLDMADLRYVVRSQILNKTTLRVVDEVMKGTNHEYEEWAPQPVPARAATNTDSRPTTFTMTHKWGQAILATPLGVAVVYLLLEHQRALGAKRVTAVTVFRRPCYDPDRPYGVNLCFHIEPIEAIKP